MRITTLYFRNEVSPLAFRFHVDVEKESFNECIVEIDDSEELPKGDWRQVLVRRT